jgi:hypothetical protein
MLFLVQQFAKQFTAEFGNVAYVFSDVWIKDLYQLEDLEYTDLDEDAKLTKTFVFGGFDILKNVFSVLGLVTSKGGKRQAAIGMDALKELFLARYIVS